MNRSHGEGRTKGRKEGNLERDKEVAITRPGKWYERVNYGFEGGKEEYRKRVTEEGIQMRA